MFNPRFDGLQFLGLLTGFFEGSYFRPFGDVAKTEETLKEQRTFGHKDIIIKRFTIKMIITIKSGLNST